MKKKILSILLCAAMITVFTSACSSKSSSSNSSVVKSEGKEVTADPVDKRTVFVTPEWVKSVMDGNQKESDNYVILEASWGTYKESPDYEKGHIPGALHVDISSIECEPDWNLCEPSVVEKAMLDLGITKDTNVILYGSDVSGTCRVAYAYLWAGVENVKVLNGSLTAWNKAGYDLDTKIEVATAAKDFGTTVPAHPEYWTSIKDAKDKLENDPNFKLVSIRSREEFEGKTSGYSYIDRAGEPKGAVWGHAGSDPNHMEEYLHDDGTYITTNEMIKMWSDCNFTMDNHLAFYCGTGWRATIPFLLCYEGGYDNVSLYDGGWFQWQMNDDYPVQVGDPASGKCEYTTVGKLPTDKAGK